MTSPLAAGPARSGVAAALGGVALCSGVVALLDGIAPADSLSVLYLLPVLFVSVVWGLGPGLLASLASGLAFNVLFLEPTGRVTIADGRNVAALVTFVVVAVTTSRVAALARARAEEAEARRREAEAAADVARRTLEERDALQAEAVEAQALRRSDELKTAILRAVSHDLRSPLTSILTAGTALGSPALDAEDREALAAGVVAEAERLAHVVDNLLDLSRLQAGQAVPRPDWCALDEVLHAAAEQTGAAVRFALADDLPLLRADAAQLERAFANLIANAGEHGGGTPVSVRARAVGHRLVVRIVDGGPGIPAAEQARIFEPFWRGDGAAGAGSGLGLAIVRGFVEGNGGRVAVESLPGQGTSFVVDFPLDRVAVP